MAFRKFSLALMIVPSGLNSITAWERSIAATQKSLHYVHNLSTVVLFLSSVWLIVAIAVDIVSDASVRYVEPFWAIGGSLAVNAVTWALSQGIAAYARREILRQEIEQPTEEEEQ